MSEMVLVVGAGVSGLAAAVSLAEEGVNARVVEKEPYVGGQAAQYTCKATDECQKCNVCLTPRTIEEARAHPFIDISTGCELSEVKGSPGQFSVTLTHNPTHIDENRCTGCGLCVVKCPEEAISPPHMGQTGFVLNPEKCVHFDGGECEECQTQCPADAVNLNAEREREKLDAAAVILAVGHQPFDVKTLGRYSTHSPHVISAEEFEREVEPGDTLNKYMNGCERIAFVQCVGSREEADASYCSRVCCGYALRSARFIKNQLPESELSIFYMDVQNFGKDWAHFREECRQDGVKFIRGKPARITVDEQTDHPVRVIYEQVEGEGRQQYPADMVILSVGIRPSPDRFELAQMLGVNLNENGFFASAADGVTSSASGIFTAGTCQQPRDIAESVSHGQKAAVEAISMLKGRCK